VQDFVKETPLANEADFVLLDFNEETLVMSAIKSTGPKISFPS